MWWRLIPRGETGKHPSAHYRRLSEEYDRPEAWLFVGSTSDAARMFACARRCCAARFPPADLRRQDRREPRRDAPRRAGCLCLVGLESLRRWSVRTEFRLEHIIG